MFTRINELESHEVDSRIHLTVSKTDPKMQHRGGGRRIALAFTPKRIR